MFANFYSRVTDLTEYHKKFSAGGAQALQRNSPERAVVNAFHGTSKGRKNSFELGGMFG